MQLTPLTQDCADGRTCPGVRATDRGTVIITGYALAEADLTRVPIKLGEVAVEIPVAVFREAARAYRE